MKTLSTISSALVLLIATAGIAQAQSYEQTGGSLTAVNLDYVDEGDIILIRSAVGGYLKDDGDGTVSTHANFNDQGQLWEVEYNQNGFGHMFRNLESGNYLKIDNPNGVHAGTVTGNGNAASFVQDSITSSSAQTFDHKFAYSMLKVDAMDQCISVSATNDTTLEAGPCSSLNQTWRYEIVQRAQTPADWEELFDCVELSDSFCF